MFSAYFSDFEDFKDFEWEPLEENFEGMEEEFSVPSELVLRCNGREIARVSSEETLFG